MSRSTPVTLVSQSGPGQFGPGRPGAVAARCGQRRADV